MLHNPSKNIENTHHYSVCGYHFVHTSCHVIQDFVQISPTIYFVIFKIIACCANVTYHYCLWVVFDVKVGEGILMKSNWVLFNPYAAGG